MKRITYISSCILLLMHPSTSPATNFMVSGNYGWQDDAKVFSCPAKTSIGATITLIKSVQAGQELAITAPDGTYYFLVVGMPDAGMKSLMTPEELDAKTSITLDTRSLSGYSGKGNGQVFKTAGTYTLYLSDNLESEDGGYKCSIRVMAGG